MFAALESRPFRWVWGAALSGDSGRFGVILVAGWEAFRLGHGSALWPSLVSFLLLVPSTLFGLLAGGVADRVNRARQAASGQLVNALACGAAVLLTAAGHLDLLAVLVVAAVVGAGNSVQGPAWQALVPRLVGPERLLNASLMVRIAQQGAEMTGPAVGTLALAVSGPAAAFAVCAGLYAAGTLMFWRVGRVVPERPPARSVRGVWSPVAEGLRYVRAQAPLGTLLAWVGLHCSLTMASIGILPVVAVANLGGGAGVYGLLLTAFGLGSVLGPLGMMWLGRRVDPVTQLVVAGVLSGAPLVSLGLVPNVAVDITSAALAGAAQAVFMAGIYSLTQGVAADAMRGRVASIQLSLTTGAMGLTSLGWGALAAVMAPGVVLALPGLGFVLACVPFARRRQRIRAAVRTRPGGRRPPAAAAVALGADEAAGRL